jgi:hypothetical protein
MERKMTGLPAASAKIRRKYPVDIEQASKDVEEVGNGAGFAPDPFDRKGLNTPEWKAKSWPIIRATLLALHLNEKYRVTKNRFAVECAGWDLAEGFGFLGFGDRHYWLRNECGCSAAVLDLDGRVLKSFFIDTFRAHEKHEATEKSNNALRALVEAYPQKIFCLATRNSAVPSQWKIPTSVVDAVNAVVGETKLLQDVGYRQPYGCIGVIGSPDSKPVEFLGARGTLMRIEAKIVKGECVQTKCLHFDLAKEIIKAVPPVQLQPGETAKTPIHGTWANDPIDLMERDTKKGLKPSSFPGTIEYLPHNKNRARALK